MYMHVDYVFALIGRGTSAADQEEGTVRAGTNVP